MSPPWETVAAEALIVPSLAYDSPAIGLFPSRAVSLFDQATAYARASFTQRRPVYEAAMDLARRIRADFVYDPEATKVSTPAHVAFEHRHGVCQDFAHIMIAALRGLGLPALYVSGYIRTIPPPGKQRLAGADASHAWVSLWCGASMGWMDFDPTNAIAIQNDHVEVAQRARLFRRLADREHGPFVRKPRARGRGGRRSDLTANRWRRASGRA